MEKCDNISLCSYLTQHIDHSQLTLSDFLNGLLLLNNINRTWKVYKNKCTSVDRSLFLSVLVLVSHGYHPLLVLHHVGPGAATCRVLVLTVLSDLQAMLDSWYPHSEATSTDSFIEWTTVKAAGTGTFSNCWLFVYYQREPIKVASDCEYI